MIYSHCTYINLESLTLNCFPLQSVFKDQKCVGKLLLSHSNLQDVAVSDTRRFPSVPVSLAA